MYAAVRESGLHGMRTKVRLDVILAFAMCVVNYSKKHYQTVANLSLLRLSTR